MGEGEMVLVLGEEQQNLQTSSVLWISCAQQIGSSCANKKWRLPGFYGF